MFFFFFVFFFYLSDGRDGTFKKASFTASVVMSLFLHRFSTRALFVAPPLSQAILQDSRSRDGKVEVVGDWDGSSAD